MGERHCRNILEKLQAGRLRLLADPNGHRRRLGRRGRRSRVE
jgi:hypothetical protein